MKLNFTGLSRYYKTVTQEKLTPRYQEPKRDARSDELWAYNGSDGLIRYRPGLIIIELFDRDKPGAETIYRRTINNVTSVGAKNNYFWWIQGNGQTYLYDVVHKSITSLPDFLLILDYAPNHGAYQFWAINRIGDLRVYTDLNSLEHSRHKKITLQAKLMDLTCGDNFALLLDETGQIYASGNNDRGQLGDGTTKSHLRTILPISNPFLKGIISIKASVDSAAALSVSGQTYHWGGSNPKIVVGSSAPVFKLLSSTYMLSRDKILLLTGQSIKTEDNRPVINAAAGKVSLCFMDDLSRLYHIRLT
jgi:hypothetical protein